MPCCKKSAVDESAGQASLHPPPKPKIPSLTEMYESMKNDPENDSYTKKVLTTDLIDLYEGQTTENGVGLNDSIYINNLGMQIKSPRVADKLSYRSFPAFFEPIVEASQNVSLDYGLISVIDKGSTSSYEVFNLQDPSIVYCEVSVVRNLDQFELLPVLPDSEYTDLHDQLDEIKQNLFNDHNETEIPEEWQIKANNISDILTNAFHVNLQEIQSISAFQSQKDESITLGMLTNYGDHLQIIASHNSARVGDIFNEVAALFTNPPLEKEKFAVVGDYGFITFNPEDFGNGFNVKLKCHLPFTSRLPYIETIIKQYELSVISVEEDYVTLGNIRKIGMSEPDIIDGFLQSCYYIIHQFENQLMNECPKALDLDIMPVESLDKLVEMINENYSRSFTKKYLSEDLVSKMRNVSTKFGGRLAHCLRYTAYIPWSVYPRACDHDAYNVYQRFFNQILLEHNKLDGFDHPMQPDYGEAIERDTIEHPYIKSYWISFVRNLKQFPFPMLISRNDRAQVESKICSALGGLPGEYIPLADIENVEIKSQNRIRSKSVANCVLGLLRDWPNNRGVFVHGENNEECEILAVVNHEDHLTVHGVDFTGKSLDKLYNKMTSIMKYLDQKLAGQFAVKPHYGFLSFCPFYVGTGMKIGTNIRLNNMEKTLSKLDEECQKNKLFYQGTNGDGVPIINNEMGIGYNFCLGITEIKTLKSFIFYLSVLIEREENLEDYRIQNLSYREMSKEGKKSGDQAENDPPAGVNKKAK